MSKHLCPSPPLASFQVLLPCSDASLHGTDHIVQDDVIHLLSSSFHLGTLLYPWHLESP